MLLQNVTKFKQQNVINQTEVLILENALEKGWLIATRCRHAVQIRLAYLATLKAISKMNIPLALGV